MSGAWTPGPWDAGRRVIEVGGADFTPIDAAEYAVAYVPVSRQANANLIASAPKLYGLAEIAAEYLESKGIGLGLADTIRQALSEARGDA